MVGGEPTAPASPTPLTPSGLVVQGVFSNAVILPLYFLSSSVFPLDPSLSSAQMRVVYPEWLVTLVERRLLVWRPVAAETRT